MLDCETCETRESMYKVGRMYDDEPVMNNNGSYIYSLKLLAFCITIFLGRLQTMPVMLVAFFTSSSLSHSFQHCMEVLIIFLGSECDHFLRLITSANCGHNCISPIVCMLFLQYKSALIIYMF